MPRTTAIDPTAWVDAAPFAAHLTHLASSTGLPWPVVAAYAGVSQRTAARLVLRRCRLRRIPRLTAQQIIAVRPSELAILRSRWVDAQPSCRRVADLVARGVPLALLARQLGCSPDLVARLADGSPASIPAEVALRARVASETVDRASYARVLRAA